MTDEPGEPQFAGSQRMGQDLATEQHQQLLEQKLCECSLSLRISRRNVTPFPSFLSTYHTLRLWLFRWRGNRKTSVNFFFLHNFMESVFVLSTEVINKHSITEIEKCVVWATLSTVAWKTGWRALELCSTSLQHEGGGWRRKLQDYS